MRARSPFPASLVLLALGALATGCSCTTVTGDDGGVRDGSRRDGAATDGTVTNDGTTSMDGAAGDGGNACPGVGEVRCGAACVNTQVDPAHCGSCTTTCAATQVCISSGCANACPPGLSACVGTCVDTSSDNRHCGVCGTACPSGQGCVAGACVPAIVVGPPPARCVGGGPPITIGGGTAPICTGDITARTFTHGLCTCRDIGVPVLGSELTLDAYDSTLGPYVPGAVGGSCGANGRLITRSTVTVSGDLETTGAPGYTADAVTDVSGDLRVRHDLVLHARLTVGHDGFVGGTISGASPGSFGGVLHTPACGSAPATVTSSRCASEPVTVADPCPCAATERVPIAEIVRYYSDATHNDNATIGLAPDALATGGGARLDLPCGYYYLTRIGITAPTVIAVHGRTAIFIGGSIEVTGLPRLTFALDPGGTLDVFVAGTLHAEGPLRFGTAAYPARSRMYVGGICAGDGASCASRADCCSLDCGGAGAGTTCNGNGTPPPFSVALESQTELAGLFYSPNGMFLSSSDLNMYGAIFAGEYTTTGTTRIHYDLAAHSAANDCTPPTPPVDAGTGADGSRPDAGPPPVCRNGATPCGPALPACPTSYLCVTGCCAFLG